MILAVSLKNYNRMVDAKVILSLRKHEQFFINDTILERIEKEKIYNTNEITRTFSKD